MALRAPVAALADPRVAVAALCVALVAVRLLSLLLVREPGYTDAFYYFLVAERVASGQGLTADFIWAPLEDHGALPVASHRFWMPLATLVQAAGIVVLGAVVGPLLAAQLAIIAVAAALPALAHAAARSLGADHGRALAAGAIAGLGGLLAPGWVALDSFAPAAVLGTAFFLLLRRASGGDVRAGALAGLAVGLLYLARAEGALFGLALLALRSHAGLAGAAVALAIGGGWQLRQVAIGFPTELLSRSALLVRYEDFWRPDPPTLEAYLAAWPAPLADKAAALGMNVMTLAMALGLVLVPLLVAGAWRLRARADVRAWAGLALLILLAQSLVWTLHSTRGSYFHSLAAFVPFGCAIALAAPRRWTRGPVVAGALAAVAILSAVALMQWDDAFNGQLRERRAALAALPVPEGRLMAADAAAWRYVSGRPVVVIPRGADVHCAMNDHEVVAVIVEDPGEAWVRLFPETGERGGFRVAGRAGDTALIVRDQRRCERGLRP